MKAIIEQATGKVLFAVADGVNIDLLDGQVVVDKIPTAGYYDFSTGEFYDL